MSERETVELPLSKYGESLHVGDRIVTNVDYRLSEGYVRAIVDDKTVLVSPYMDDEISEYSVYSRVDAERCWHRPKDPVEIVLYDFRDAAVNNIKYLEEDRTSEPKFIESWVKRIRDAIKEEK